MLAITFIASVACVVLITFGLEVKTDRGGLVACIGVCGILSLIVILHAARIGLVTL